MASILQSHRRGNRSQPLRYRRLLYALRPQDDQPQRGPGRDGVMSKNVNRLVLTLLWSRLRGILPNGEGLMSSTTEVFKQLRATLLPA